jgi:5-methylcytosine-specific restriction enzyme A
MRRCTEMRPKSIYNDWTWFKTRALKKRLQPLCEKCLEQNRLTVATIVHHKVSVEEAPHLMYALDNLQSLCRPCHETVHGRGEAPHDYSDAFDPRTGLYTDPNHPSNRRPVTRGWGTRAERLQNE